MTHPLVVGLALREAAARPAARHCCTLKEEE